MNNLYYVRVDLLSGEELERYHGEAQIECLQEYSKFNLKQEVNLNIYDEQRINTDICCISSKNHDEAKQRALKVRETMLKMFPAEKLKKHNEVFYKVEL